MMKTIAANRSARLRVRLLAGVGIALISSTPALAADADAGGSTAVSGEIVVTANKREQNAQDIGIAVSALGQEAIQSVSGQDFSSVAKMLPSVQIQPIGGPQTTIINIRGVSQNDYADGQEAPIAFYSDGVYVSALAAISGRLFDLERVEVLRGPQGTLFGRNSTGGLVNAITAKPTDTFDGYVMAGVEKYGKVTTEGAVSGPLSESVRARLSFQTQNGGDYYHNRIGHDLGAIEQYAGRLQIAADLSPSDTLNLKVEVLHNPMSRQAGQSSWLPATADADGLGVFVGPNQLATFQVGFFPPMTTCAGCDATGYKEPDSNPFTVSFNSPSWFKRTFWGATANYVHDFGNMSLTSISDYQHVTKASAEEQDLTPANLMTLGLTQNFWQASQELRLAGHSDSLQWTVGLYGLKSDSKSTQFYDLLNYAPYGLAYYPKFEIKTDNLAAFGQLEYKVNDQFKIIGGLRYSVDWKEINYVNNFQTAVGGPLDAFLPPFFHVAGGLPIITFNEAGSFYALVNPPVGVAGPAGQARKRFADWSGKIELDYTPTNDLLVYATVNRGNKGGGFNAPGVVPFGVFSDAQFPYAKEVLVNYEGGFKLTLPSVRGHLNVSAFHYDYDNYQSFQANGLALAVINRDAKVNGVEAELALRPASGLDLQAFVTYLDTTVKNVTLPNGRVADRRMPDAPEWSVGFFGRYQFDLGGGTAAIQTNWKYNSSQYLTVLNPQVSLQPGYVVGDVRVSYELPGTRVEVAAYVNNVTNKWYRLFSADLAGIFGNTDNLYAKPRVFGASVTYRFK